MKKIVTQINYFILFFVFISILIFICHRKILYIWLSSDSYYSYRVYFSMLLNTILQIINYPYSTILSGMGKLRLVTYFTYLEITIYFILCFTLKLYIHDFTSIIWAVTFTRLIGTIIAPIQVNKILNNTSQRFWMN